MNKATKIALGIVGTGAAGIIGFNALSNTTPSQANQDQASIKYENRDYDCGDFSTHAEAQRFFESEGPGDPHRLDRDNDGLVCETLP
jgi:hypothetical protein